MANPKAKFVLGFRRGRKRPGSKLIATHCEKCGYRARITRSWLLRGLPTCYDGGKFVIDEPELMQTLILPRKNLEATLRGIIESATVTLEGEQQNFNKGNQN